MADVAAADDDQHLPSAGNWEMRREEYLQMDSLVLAHSETRLNIVSVSFCACA